ncbi:histidine phosphatase family protein [Alkalihalobacillus sp. AL-G]|uniref:histidine phosphatase family protein n=1 Tax=Alkalihalobacillus sp. AL-G TaxID=2926399 RepID=UPI00272CA374|nr:histidine phosphatase family protein [Alkalihalobacillus sp. AL-G]WLD94616.1 histidine phosphatase family protein [Alkalihalobacillus sp. AL-G]
MKNIYIVRHCKAEGQAADAPLTALGVIQSKELAQFLSDKNIEHIVTSPYERAVQTIQPFADEQGIEMALDNRLEERVLSSETRSDWMEMLRKTYDDLELCYEGGESSNMAMVRAVAVVEDVLKRPGRNSVIVTHGNLMSLLLKHFDERIGFEEWKALTNPDVYELRIENRTTSIERVWLID